MQEATQKIPVCMYLPEHNKIRWDWIIRPGWFFMAHKDGLEGVGSSGFHSILGGIAYFLTGQVFPIMFLKLADMSYLNEYIN